MWGIISLNFGSILKQGPALTLEKAVTQARQKEAVHEQQSIVRSYVLSENKIDSVKSDRDTAKTHREDTQGISQRGCRIKGHWVRFCLSKKVHEVDDRDGESDEESDAYMYLGTIDSVV